MSKAIRTVGLFGKYKDPSVRDTLTGLSAHLEERGVDVLLGDTTAQEIEGPRAELGAAGAQTSSIDLAIVIGGDGTMLHVARSLAARGTPLVGVNLGRLGFLTEIPADKMYADVERILDGDYTIESRMMLDVDIVENGRSVHRATAFNDVVVTKGEVARLIEIEARVDGQFVTRTRADGIIVATPTGSTAYALSAGGPILHPLLAAIVLVPICPHHLGNRPIVFEASSTIRLQPLHLTPKGAEVSIDGHVERSLTGDELIEVRRAQQVVRLVHVRGHSHYEALRYKLGWGA